MREPRRDRCYELGRRCVKLTQQQALDAWCAMADRLLELGEAEMPKFVDLFDAIEKAADAGRESGGKTKADD